MEIRRVWFRGGWAAYIGKGTSRRRISLRTTDPAEADRRIAQISREYERPDRITVEWLWHAYCDEYSGRKVVETMDYRWKTLAPIFGHLTPDLISVETCREYIERRSPVVKDGTINTELGYLASVLNWGVKRGLIEKAPHILRPPKPPPRDRWMTREEARAMIDAAGWPHARLAMILLLSTAARVSAILELTWDRVDFEAGTIQLSDDLNSSRKKSRATVPMNAMARAALTEAKTGAVSDHVIEYGGKPIKSLKKAIAGAAKRANLEGISAHVFRHTAAVWMAEARVPMERIAQFLGHRDSKVTERIYARFSPDHLREEAEVLNLGIWAAGSPGPKNRL